MGIGTNLIGWTCLKSRSTQGDLARNRTSHLTRNETYPRARNHARALSLLCCQEGAVGTPGGSLRP